MFLIRFYALFSFCTLTDVFLLWTKELKEENGGKTYLLYHMVQ